MQTEVKLSKVEQARQALADRLEKREADLRSANDACDAASQELCDAEDVHREAMEVYLTSLAPK